ncbi:unnamed protein product [Larinioides sclopetarius]|uniref:Uncharacterized protein n=1 Tax=Larinioides sclopetarius TaxID=280406 RepID=A0AAV2BAQ4_9ARAC
MNRIREYSYTENNPKEKKLLDQKFLSTLATPHHYCSSSSYKMFR